MTNQNPYFSDLSPDWIDMIYERYADSLEDVVLFAHENVACLGFVHLERRDVGYDLWHKYGSFNPEGIDYGGQATGYGGGGNVRPLTDDEFDSLGFAPVLTRPAFNPADFGKAIPLDEVEKGDRVVLVEPNGDAHVITVEEVWIDRHEQTFWLNSYIRSERGHNFHLSHLAVAYLIDRPEPSPLEQAADYLNVYEEDLVHAIEKYNLKEVL